MRCGCMGSKRLEMEDGGVNKHWRKAMVRTWFFLLGWLVVGAALAAPGYVTAWPRQVPIEQPDPVLGDKPYWEHWVYSENFARRFSGTTDGKRFTVEGADPELKGKLHALVLRTYKKNLWAGVNPDYPEQYACEIDVYFDDRIELPFQDQRRANPRSKAGPIPSYERLIAANEADRKALQQSKSIEYILLRAPVLFAMPPDGRLHYQGSVDHRQPLVPGLAFLRLVVGFDASGCAVATPAHPQGADWLSLTGHHPYQPKDLDDKKPLNIPIKGSYDRKYEGFAFDPGPDPESQGLFRIPRAFHEVALQKAALVKMLNWCINQRFAGEQRNAKQRIPDVWREIDRRCSNAEKNGIIDPGYPGKEGLQEYGY